MSDNTGAAIDKAHADFDRAFADGRYRDADRHLRLAAELLAKVESPPQP